MSLSLDKRNSIYLHINPRTKWWFSHFRNSLWYWTEQRSFKFCFQEKQFSVLFVFDECLCLSNNSRMPFYQTVATKYRLCYLQYLKLVKTIPDPRRPSKKLAFFRPFQFSSSFANCCRKESLKISIKTWNKIQVRHNYRTFNLSLFKWSWWGVVHAVN